VEVLAAVDVWTVSYRQKTNETCGRIVPPRSTSWALIRQRWWRVDDEKTMIARHAATY